MNNARLFVTIGLIVASMIMFTISKHIANDVIWTICYISGWLFGAGGVFSLFGE
jgi:glucose uptake protein GlcU